MQDPWGALKAGAVADRTPVSVAIIARDEESRLPGCLDSLAGFDDIVVVVDSRTSDATARVAEEAGCRVFVEEWGGFGPAKRSAVEKCLNEWVLVIDADERLPRETRDEIWKETASPRAEAYSFPRKNYFRGKWIRHGGWWPDRVVRLFRKDYAEMSVRLVHEKVSAREPAEIFSPIEHFTVDKKEDLLEKANLYSSLSAEEMFRQGKRASAFKAFLRSVAAFIRGYFLKRGFLDGAEGLLIAFTGSVTVFYKYIKLTEIQDRDAA